MIEIFKLFHPYIYTLKHVEIVIYVKTFKCQGICYMKDKHKKDNFVHGHLLIIK